MDPIAALMVSTQSDIYLHSGALFQPTDDIVNALAHRPRRERAHFFVATHGGQARTAYRIMRSLRHAYSHITMVVAGPCKSAGTLLAIGADELVMSGSGELGPLDVQILKDNEIFMRQSGLAADYAFERLALESRKIFGQVFMDMKINGLTTTTAVETAAKFAAALMAPIYAQIDPIRIGEMMMMQMVGQRYALALTMHGATPRANIAEPAITRLVSGYQQHDYAIDRQEAMELFKVVRSPTDEERAVIAAFEEQLSTPANPALTIRVPTPSESPDAPPNELPPSDRPGSDSGNADGKAGSPSTGDSEVPGTTTPTSGGAAESS